MKNLLKYSASVNADLVCIMNFYENSLMHIIGGSYETQIITNEAQIPVLCINPTDNYILEASVFES